MHDAGGVAPTDPAGAAAPEEVRPGSRFGPEDDVFELGEEVGSGAVARVYTCQQLRTGQQFAVKVINLQRLKLMGDVDSQMVKLNREVQILQGLHHEKIVNLCTVHKTDNWCFLVMELVRGGELFYQIVQHRSLTELEARYVFRQILEGIGYMHSMRVIHRDLKPENILIVRTLPAAPPMSGNLHDVKIADFGLSKVVNEGHSFPRTFVGTPQYWAPEVLNCQGQGGSYDQAADFWSLGAVLFVMLCGRYPFVGKKQPLEDEIRAGAFNMDTPKWAGVSDEAKDLVKGLLRVDPRKRLGLEDCIKHPWILGHARIRPPCRPVPALPAPSRENDPTAANNNGGPTVVEVSVSPPEPEAPCPRVVSVDSGPSHPVPEAKPYHNDAQKLEVPAIQVGSDKMETEPEENATIFCLNELLKLQVSIAGSLEMACLAFRHTDEELTDAIRTTLRQARSLSQLAMTVVSRYAQVAQQVSQTVLPDLSLAVQEKEPSLAVNLLSMVKNWVVEMKASGEDMQVRYAQLQSSVHQLIRRAQKQKAGSDLRLAEVLQAVEADGKSPLGQHPLALAAPPASGSGTEDEGRMTDAVRQPAGGRQPAVALGPSLFDVSPGAGTGGVQKPAAGIVGGMDTALNSPAQLNGLTRQLFEQLHELASGSAAKGSVDVPMLGAAGMDATPTMTKAKGESTLDLEADAWKRDVLDLLFMAPGIAAASLPKLETFHFDPKVRQGDDLEQMNVDDDEKIGRAAEGPANGGQAAIVCYKQPESAKTATQAATHSAAALLRALRELKRVDEILHGCSAFWQNMDGTVQKLAQMKEHTECLVSFAANSARLRERFEQRLGEYTHFWDALERLCRQYVVDHQNASKRMYEFLREVVDASDLIDTAESARMGMVAAAIRR